MPKKIRELKAMLHKAGFEPLRMRGSHQRWRHPQLPAFPVTLAGKDSQDAKAYQELLVAKALAKLKEQNP